jgi:hypothetical protein
MDPKHTVLLVDSIDTRIDAIVSGTNQLEHLKVSSEEAKAIAVQLADHAAKLRAAFADLRAGALPDLPVAAPRAPATVAGGAPAKPPVPPSAAPAPSPTHVAGR